MAGLRIEGRYFETLASLGCVGQVAYRRGHLQTIVNAGEMGEESVSKPIIHVHFHPSGAGTLRHVLAGLNRTEQVTCMHDDLSFGPVGSGDAARLAWVAEELGLDGWELALSYTVPFLEASCSEHTLPVAWVSRCDSTTYAGFLFWLSHLGDTPCKVIDVTEMTMMDPSMTPPSGKPVYSPSALQPADMARLLGTEVDLDPASRTRYRRLWKRLVADNAPLRVVGRKEELASAPLTHFDLTLLSCASAQWRKMARVVGEALARSLTAGVSHGGDLVLASRARVLAENGALEWRGDLHSMHTCEVRLPGRSPP